MRRRRRAWEKGITLPGSVAARKYDSCFKDLFAGLLRPPAAPLLLPFITFGIYLIVWYAKDNI